VRILIWTVNLPDVQREPFVAIIAAYFDESGKKNDHPVVTFCGVCAALPKVRLFDSDWESLLRNYGLDELHMVSAANHSIPLSAKIPNQTLPERIEALKPSADCINKHLELGLLQAWDVKGFNSLSKPAKKGLGDPNDPYYSAFARGLVELADYVQEDDRISLVCDDDAETAWDCYKHYRGIRQVEEKIRKKTISLSFADDKYFPGLQAADMVAWLTRREARLKFYGDRFPMRALFEHMVVPQRPGQMQWLRMFATEDTIKGLSDADWGDEKTASS
jgi:hypothetical protein